MSKIIMFIQNVLAKVFAHQYTGITVKTPFINVSFAPMISTVTMENRIADKIKGLLLNITEDLCYMFFLRYHSK